MAAAKAARVNRQHTYDYRAADPIFAAEWEQALEEAADHLELEARRRAHDGLMRKKFDKGQPVMDPATGEQYVEMEYSDTLLIFLLKGARPEKYRERTEMELKGHARMSVVEEIEDATASDTADDPQDGEAAPGAGGLPQE